MLIGGGSVGYCNRNSCNIAYSSGFKFPNGLVKGRDGLIYVPNSLLPVIEVFSLSEDHLLHKVNSIKVPYPIDNMSVNENGDIYAAGLPQIYKLGESTKKPFEVNPPTGVFRIRRAGKGYEGIGRKGNLETHDAEYVVETVLEDNGSILPGSTVAVHDAQTGRFFLGGVHSPFIAMCEPHGS